MHENANRYFFWFRVYHKRAIRMLKSRVSCENGVVGLNNGARELGSWVYAKL